MDNLLDLRTILFGHVITAAISAGVMVSLYSQNRRRSPELIYWLAAFIFQFLGTSAIALRGAIPEFFSIVLGNIFLVAQALLILIGLGWFINAHVHLKANLVLGSVFILTTLYFTYAQPSLLARSINFSLALFIVCLQGAILIFRERNCRDCPSSRLTGLILGFYSLFSLIRIVSDLVVSPGNDLLSSNLPDTLVIIVYQMLSIGLTFALFLMVNRRLVIHLEDDIKKRALAEESLRKSEEKFSAAFHNIPDALVVSLAQDGTVVDVNESFSRISGFSRDEVIGKSTIDLGIWSRPEDRTEYADELLRTGRVKNFEARFLRKNGQEIIGRISSEVIQLTEGKCFLNIIRDVTESKKIKEQEKEQRVLAEALRDTATALTSTLHFDEVLERILNNIERVVPNDTANIMLVGENGMLKIVRSRGYSERGLTDLSGFNISMDEMPLLTRVAALNQPMAFPDVDLEPDWHPHQNVKWIKSYAVAPIRARGQTIGFINLDSSKAGFFNQGMAERLQAFADQASIAIENARLYEDVQEMAITDALTGLFNRRGLFQLGEREVIRSLRFNHPLAALMIDIDCFKKVNDTYGHATGDRVLAILAACLRSQVRNVDLLARYGGEEFTILLTETDQINAAKAAERLRKAVADLDIPVGGSSAGSLRITISLGLVMLSPDTLDLSHLLNCADQALYKAKKDGRNRVVIGSVNCIQVENERPLKG